MRYGGHETFPVREGWLFKGLRVLQEEPEALYDEFVADRLGVGRNMAKAIRHWLLVTGLAAAVKNATGRKTVGLRISPFGRLIWEKDRYLLRPDSWWLLHVNLVTDPGSAVVWTWFFSAFRRRRFDRSVALEALRRHVEVHEKRAPSIKTLRRDLGCLLASYAQVQPPEPTDPEDAAECPFRQLGMLSYFRESGMYQADLGRKPMSPEVLGYALAQAWNLTGDQEGHLEVTFLEAAQALLGPCAVFGLTLEELVETALMLEQACEGKVIEVSGLAGERTIRIPRWSTLTWAEKLYAESGAYHVA